MNFEKLRIWQDSVELTVSVYKLIDNFPHEEKYGLSSQSGRSVNSVGANIAESSGRYHSKDRIKFLYNAHGSLYEIKHHLTVAYKLGYIQKGELETISEKIKNLSVRLNNYIKSINPDK